MSTFTDRVEAVTIRSVDDIHAAAVALRDIAVEVAGLRVAATDNIASKEPMIDAEGSVLAADIWGWTADGERWWAAERLALASPLTHGCRYESEPFWVNAEGFRTRSPNAYLDTVGLEDFETRAMCKASIVIPVHLPFGQIGAASFGCKDKTRDDLAAEFAAHADELAVYARTFIAGYVKVHRTRQWVPGGCQLSKREVECLRWAAVGKTDREIGMILGRSHATIRFHLNNASEKLNSVNRSQTIFKAAQLGYLGLAN
jgi:DNA-binding CsgD family transcriptional regulator